MVKLRGLLGLSALIQHLVKAGEKPDLDELDAALKALISAEKDVYRILQGLEPEEVRGKNTGNTRMNSGEKRG